MGQIVSIRAACPRFQTGGHEPLELLIGIGDGDQVVLGAGHSHIKKPFAFLSLLFLVVFYALGDLRPVSDKGWDTILDGRTEIRNVAQNGLAVHPQRRHIEEEAGGHHVRVDRIGPSAVHNHHSPLQTLGSVIGHHLDTIGSIISLGRYLEAGYIVDVPADGGTEPQLDTVVVVFPCLGLKRIQVRLAVGTVAPFGTQSTEVQFIDKRVHDVRDTLVFHTLQNLHETKVVEGLQDLVLMGNELRKTLVKDKLRNLGFGVVITKDNEA